MTCPAALNVIVYSQTRPAPGHYNRIEQCAVDVQDTLAAPAQSVHYTSLIATHPMHDNKPSEALVRQLCQVAMFLTATTAWMLTLVSLMRSGLGDSAWLTLALLVFVMLSIWVPIYAMVACGPRALEASAAAAVAGIAFPVLALPLRGTSVPVAALLLLLVMIALRPHLRRAGIGIIKLAFGSLGMAIVLLTLGSAGRFFIPEELALGLASSDSHFHIAITNMIAKFQVPSIGADGLAFTQYHFGSHFIAAGIANAAETRASEVYVYWGSIALRVQLLWSLLWCNLHLACAAGALPCVRRRLLLLAPFVAMATMFFNSESFLVAVTAFLCLTPLIARYLDDGASAKSTNWLGLSIILFGAFVCAAAKVSVGYFIAAVLVFACAQRWHDRVGIAVTLSGLAALAACTLYMFQPADVSLLSAGFGILLSSYLQYTTLPTFASFMLPLLLLLWQRSVAPTVTREEQCDPVGGSTAQGPFCSSLLRRALGAVGGMRGEWQLLIVVLLSCVLVVMTVPIGSNATYFSGVLLFMSFALMPASALAALNGLVDFCPFKAMGALLWITLIAHIVNFGVELRARAAQVVACHSCAPDPSQPPSASRQLRESLRTHGKPWTNTRIRIENSAWSTLIRDVETFAAGGADAAVFVPPGNTAFWTRLQPQNPYWCISPQLMIPAMAGIPMLRGIGPASFESQCMPPGLIWYGFGRHQAQHRTGDLDDWKLCQLAKDWGLQRVYVVNAIDELGRNRRLACS